MPTGGTSQDQKAPEFVRLHISPLDAELLKTLVPPSILPSARNFSFHTLEAFPEKRYGYVELPTADAEKLRKKLNGSVFRGTKVRVDKARPEMRAEPTGDEDRAERKARRKAKKEADAAAGPSKKRKRDPETVDGVVLKDRKVKRGWTEAPGDYKKKSKRDKSKDKDKSKKEKQERKRPKSKYTEQEECLLKTKLPPNALSNVLPADDLPKKRKKGKGSAREVTVHEFEKTTKFPSFLKSFGGGESGQRATEFVEGKGWVDEDGNVVQAVSTKKSRKSDAAKRQKSSKKEENPVVEEDEDDETSSSGSSSEEDSDSGASLDEPVELVKQVAEEESDTSDEETSDASDAEQPEPASATESTRPMSSSSARNLKIQIPPPITPAASKVHPLEALYKKQPTDGTGPAQTPSQEAQPFSFFGGGGDEDEDDEEGGARVGMEPGSSMPMTPFTKQDFEWRNIRSAAPTPDTAHPSRVQNFWAPRNSDLDEEMNDMVEEADDGEGEEDGEPVEPSEFADGTKSGQSDFEKWFWENRGDLNRSWMKRRKTAAKEKRHRDNKARASKAV